MERSPTPPPAITQADHYTYMYLKDVAMTRYGHLNNARLLIARYIYRDFNKGVRYTAALVYDLQKEYSRSDGEMAYLLAPEHGGTRIEAMMKLVELLEDQTQVDLSDVQRRKEEEEEARPAQSEGVGSEVAGSEGSQVGGMQE